MILIISHLINGLFLYMYISALNKNKGPIRYKMYVPIVVDKNRFDGLLHNTSFWIKRATWLGWYQKIPISMFANERLCFDSVDT